MAQGKLTLVYFDTKGRAEVARILLHAAGRDFEDKRFKPGSPAWEDYKPKCPMGQLPVLEIDGRRWMAQSHAINKFLAEELGFNGKTSMERYTVDLVQSTFEDFLMKCVKFAYEKDETKKEEAHKEVLENAGPKMAAFLEELLKDNPTGFFVGNRVTLADIYAFDIFFGTMSDFKVVPSLDKYPLLKANTEKVKAVPKIAAYLAKRN